MVINTMGWVDGLGYDMLLHAIAALRADVVLVVGPGPPVQPAAPRAQVRAAHLTWLWGHR